MSDALDNLSTAVGCYMHRHTFICWKLLLTYIFSGFQKQLLGAERQDCILLLGGKPGLTLGWCQKGQLQEQQQSWPLFCDVHATDNATTDSLLLSPHPQHYSCFCLLVAFTGCTSISNYDQGHFLDLMASGTAECTSAQRNSLSPLNTTQIG